MQVLSAAPLGQAMRNNMKITYDWCLGNINYVEELDAIDFVIVQLWFEK
jgi:hypothetical protein